MTPTRRTATAIAVAAAALACALWLALGGADRAVRSGEASRTAVIDGAEGATQRAADLSTVRSKEPSRALAVATVDAATATSAQETQGLTVTGRVSAERTFSPDAVTTVWAHYLGAAVEGARSVKATSRAPREWAFESLPPGSWAFTAFVIEGGRVALGSVGPVYVSARTAPISIEAVEYSAGGVVTASGGQPLAGVPVTFTWTSTQPHRLPSRLLPPHLGGEGDPAQYFRDLPDDLPRARDARVRTTDALGRFSFAIPGPGTVTLRAPEATLLGPDGTEPYENHAWFISSVEDQLTPARPRLDDLVLSIHQAAKLKGRLRAGADGPEGILCYLLLLSEDVPKGASRSQRVFTDKNGEFAFERCAPGEYFLYLRSSDKAGQDYSLRVPLTLHEGEERYITDRLTPSARISGVAHDREGRPLVGVDVVATARRNSNLTRRATTDASGLYTIEALCEGVYELKLAILPDPVERLIIEVPAGGAVIEAGTLVASDI